MKAIKWINGIKVADKFDNSNSTQFHLVNSTFHCLPIIFLLTTFYHE